MRKARYAEFPEMAQKAARNEVAVAARKQRGGVGIRPTRSARETGKPQQGDGPAKEAISGLLTDFGLNPWAKRKSA